MRKIVLIAVAATLTCGNFAYVGATSAQAKDAPTSGFVVGKMIYTADKHQLGSVYNVKKDGSAEVIVDTRIVTVPAASVETKDGKLWTSLTRKQVLASR